jgi:hypothetical protein
LDPFVRLHRVDENASGDVAPMLDFLRALQRTYGVAVVLVHHARKGGANMRAGQALRGSSDLHAWGDSNVYLRRSKDSSLWLSVEHRAARALDDVPLELTGEGGASLLRVVGDCRAEPVRPSPASPLEIVERVLAHAHVPMTAREIRQAAKLRNATVGRVLARMVAAGRATVSDEGYVLGPLGSIPVTVP